MLLLAIETSCDETAVALLRDSTEVLAAQISSQIPLHRPYGGVVPEVASRNHLLMLRPLLEQVMADAGKTYADLDAVAATCGPGLASSLMLGMAAAKGLALALGKPFIAVNHMEGHLLSPFMADPLRLGVRPSVALVVSGGHTLLIEIRKHADYRKLGSTLDDAAGEAFDKTARLLGLPYPGGPEIDRLAREGDPSKFALPRSLADSGDFQFSFSGLKTAVRYLLPTLGSAPFSHNIVADVCASFQEAVVDILVQKTIAAAKATGRTLVTLSGGVSCNTRLREKFALACDRAGLELLVAPPRLCTDNAVMIAHAAALAHLAGRQTSLEVDIDPNLRLEFQ